MSEIASIFEDFKKIRNQTEMPIDKMRQELDRYKGRVCLYGAGSAGIAFLYYLRRIKIEPCCFIDGNQSRWGEYCENVEILSKEDTFKKFGPDALIIVTINTDGKRYCKSFSEELRRGGHSGVYKSLKETGFKDVIDYTFFRRCHKLFQGDPYNLPSCSDVFLMERNQDMIEKVYEYLADDLSREVYERIIKFRLIDDSITVPTQSQDMQYFEKGIYEPSDEAVFVDCGAFSGISAKTFLKINNNRFCHYYGLEPDEANYCALQEYIAELPDEIKSKMTICKKAAYDSSRGAIMYELHGPGSFIADIGQNKVESIKLDELVGSDKVTYIKMNIEGSELKALNGSSEVIKNHKPMLAIAGYHKTWDLWEVPLSIIDKRKDYKFYLRSYMNHISFVYYGL